MDSSCLNPLNGFSILSIIQLNILITITEVSLSESSISLSPVGLLLLFCFSHSLILSCLVIFLLNSIYHE